MDIRQRWVTEQDAEQARRVLGRRRLVLASGSPRRRDVLNQCGVRFEVVPSDVHETIVATDAPHGHVICWSRRKARAIAENRQRGLILGADTIVYYRRIIGKPTDQADAVAKLSLLSGKTHTVYTGLTVVSQPDGRETYGWSATRVRFHAVSERQIRRYVHTGEPMDKAGAYGIQGMGGQLVASIDGALDNVVGLPVGKLAQLLTRMKMRSGQ